MESTEVADELRILDPQAREFEANGQKYRIAQTISYDRWIDLQRTELELSFGISTKDIASGLKEAYQKLNKQEFADAAVTIHNLMMGITTINDGRAPAVLRMAALFINREGEDTKTITEEIIQAKIADWSAAGIDMVSFFRLALGCIPGFIDAYSSLSQGSSQQKSQGTEGANEKSPTQRENGTTSASKS